MPTINQLPTVTQISGGDQLPLYLPNTGDARRCSLTTLAEWLGDNNVDVDASEVSFIQAGAGAVTRTAQNKMRDIVSVKDFGAIGDGVTNDLSSIQTAIESLSAGDALFFPAGVYLVNNVVKFSGLSNNKTELSFYGDGATIKLQSSVSNSNVAEIINGSGYSVEGLIFEGNKGTVTPPGTDTSYRYFNGLYVGADAGYSVSNISITKCTFTNNAYCGTMVGSGPVQIANIGPGVDGVTISNCIYTLNEVGGAGGAQRNVSYTGNVFSDNDIYGLLVDIDSVSVSVVGNTINHLSTLGATNACLFAYNADAVNFTGNSCSGGKSGILISTGSTNAVVSGNTVSDPTGSGIIITNSVGASVSGNAVNSAGQYGIVCNTAANCASISGNSIIGSGFDGIALIDVSNITVGENNTSECNGSGVLLSGSTWVNIIGGISLNNNASNASATSSGIRLSNSSQNQVIGNRCYDSATIGSKKQNYGVLEEGTTDNNCYIGNDFSGNKTSDALFTGVSNIVIGTPTSLAQARVPNGTAAAPGLTFAGSQTTGIYRTGGGNLGFTVGGLLQALVQALASAVNYVTLRGGTTGNAAEIFAAGSDANIDLKLTGGGTGRVTLGSPLGLRQYAKASLPAATVGGFIYVTDDVGGAVPAFADGVNWRRVTDRAIIA